MAYDPVKWQMESTNKVQRSHFNRNILALALILSIIFPYVILLSRAFTGGEGFSILTMVFINTVLLYPALQVWKSPFHSPVLRLRQPTEPQSFPAQTDEVEAAIYAKAMVSARYPLLLVVIFFFCFTGIISANDYPLPNRWFDWAFAGMLIAYSIHILPTLIAEWTTPMPPSDEALEDS